MTRNVHGVMRLAGRPVESQAGYAIDVGQKNRSTLRHPFALMRFYFGVDRTWRAEVGLVLVRTQGAVSCTRGWRIPRCSSWVSIGLKKKENAPCREASCLFLSARSAKRLTRQQYKHQLQCFC